MARLALVVLVALLGCLILAACGSDARRHQTAAGADDQRNARGHATPAEQNLDNLQGTVTVLAAASLTESFERIADDFEERHPDVTVRTSFGASSTLARQVKSGASADVFASADPDQFENLPSAGEPEVFANNHLQLAVPASNPADVRELSDLDDPDVRIAFCASDAPCGEAAEHTLNAADLQITPDTLGNDVKKVVTLLRLGEVDAGLVYHSDVVAAGDELTGIELSSEVAAARDYPVAALPEAPNPTVARAFVAYLSSSDAREELRDAGFDPV